MASILSLTEYKTAKGITTTDYDAQLSALVGMANDWIEKYCNRQFGIGTYTEQYEGVIDIMGRYIFKVKNKPITSITSVVVHYIGVTTPLSIDTDELDIFANDGYCYYSNVFDPSIAVIREEYRTNFYYVITYEGGAAVPEGVKLAAINIASNMYEYLSRTNSVVESGMVNMGELMTVQIGDYKEIYDPVARRLLVDLHSKKGLILSPTIEALLAPYATRGINLK